MRILFWSTVTPIANSGYGKVTRNLSLQLQKLGHDVSIIPNLGQEFGESSINGIPIYHNPACGKHMGLEFVTRLFHKIKADVCVWHGDCWGWHDTFAQATKAMPMILHVPIDHFPLSPYEYHAMRQSRAVMTLSHFAVDVARQGGIPQARYAPHGVDTAIFHPIDRGTARTALNWQHGHFYYLFVGTNLQDRKNVYNVLRGYKLVLDMQPGAREQTRLYMHTYNDRDHQNQEGYELMNLAISLGIADNVMFTNPATYSEGVSEETMSLLYNAADVHIMPSKAEGFGLPILEAGACGTPSIVTDFSSMPELVTDQRGWLIPVVDYEVQMLQGITWQAIPSTQGLADSMLQAYCRRDLLRSRSEAMLEFSRGMTWEKAAEPWRELLDNFPDEPPAGPPKTERPSIFPAWLPSDIKSNQGG